jgi:hypothetical protein
MSLFHQTFKERIQSMKVGYSIVSQSGKLNLIFLFLYMGNDLAFKYVIALKDMSDTVTHELYHHVRWNPNDLTLLKLSTFSFRTPFQVTDKDTMNDLKEQALIQKLQSL